MCYVVVELFSDLFIYILSYCFSFFFFFFFQAEDGIRDTSVTGVQTCALPISFGGLGDLFSSIFGRRGTGARLDDEEEIETAISIPFRVAALGGKVPVTLTLRSEERRVGKECRSRWWLSHEKKKHSRRSRVPEG